MIQVTLVEIALSVMVVVVLVSDGGVDGDGNMLIMTTRRRQGQVKERII